MVEPHFTEDPSGVVHRRLPSEIGKRHKDEREITADVARERFATRPDLMCRRCFPGTRPMAKTHNRTPR